MGEDVGGRLRGLASEPDQVGGQEFDARTGQIKPIPPELKSALEIEAKNLLYVAIMTPTIYTVNKTLYYVSPIQGKGG